MLNPFDLIYSEKLKKKLMKDKHQFTFLNVMNLIFYRRELTMEKRHKLYLELKKMFKNEKITFSNICDDYEVTTTTDDIVDRLIKKDYFSLMNFKSNPKNKYFYGYKLFYTEKNGIDKKIENNGFYTTYSKCLSNIKKDILYYKKKKSDNLPFDPYIPKFDLIEINRTALDEKGRIGDAGVLLLFDNLKVYFISYTGKVSNMRKDKDYKKYVTPDFRPFEYDPGMVVY